MITIVVYTLNDQQSIATCLRSLVSQHSEGGHEVVVIDDGSTDGTADIVARDYPQFQLLRQARTAGWVAVLREHLAGFGGEVLAFLGAHCQAEADWLVTVEREMARDEPPVITGSGEHGRQRFLQRFQALSVHGDYVGQAEMGIPIAYRPALRIQHDTHSLAEMFGMWYGEMAVNSLAMKRADPTAPGAGLLRLGPIAAAGLAAKRWLQGLACMSRARRWLGVSLPELGLHAGLLALMMPAYFSGLCREWFRTR